MPKWLLTGSVCMPPALLFSAVSIQIAAPRQIDSLRNFAHHEQAPSTVALPRSLLLWIGFLAELLWSDLCNAGSIGGALDISVQLEDHATLSSISLLHVAHSADTRPSPFKPRVGSGGGEI